jgi:hypothetical protein
VEFSEAAANLVDERRLFLCFAVLLEGVGGGGDYFF